VKYSIYLFIILIFCGCATSSRKIASEEAIYDIVFDIDWTIVYQVREKYIGSAGVMKIGEEYYHESFDLISLMDDLFARPNVRVSFFSGGSSERNMELLAKIKLSNGKSLQEMAYKILSLNDLEIRPGVNPNDSSVKFSKKYQKNLLRVNSDLKNVMMIDDIENFLPTEQSDHMFFLQKTYEFFPSFSAAETARLTNELRADYIPSSYQEYIGEKHKLAWVKDVLDRSFEKIEVSKESLSSAVQSLIFDQDHKRIARPKFYHTQAECYNALNTFLSY
jgi:hypothetical protein